MLPHQFRDNAPCQLGSSYGTRTTRRDGAQGMRSRTIIKNPWASSDPQFPPLYYGAKSKEEKNEEMKCCWHSPGLKRSKINAEALLPRGALLNK